MAPADSTQSTQRSVPNGSSTSPRDSAAVDPLEDWALDDFDFDFDEDFDDEEGTF
jgi:hypothetical protein